MWSAASRAAAGASVPYHEPLRVPFTASGSKPRDKHRRVGLAQWWEALVTLCFPPQCVVCKAPGREVCSQCWGDIPRIVEPLCQGCGRPFDPRARAADVCGACRTGEFRFDCARAVGRHVSPLRDLVLAFKFGGRERLAQPLGELLSDYVLRDGSAGACLADAELIVPVPLHTARERDRGYNQAQLLAEQLSRAMGVPLATGALRRVRDTPPQTELTPSQRRENVRGAFGVFDADVVQGRTVLLLDDVLTTGATLSECAKVLKRAGTARALALTVSRSTPDWDAKRDLF